MKHLKLTVPVMLLTLSLCLLTSPTLAQGTLSPRPAAVLATAAASASPVFATAVPQPTAAFGTAVPQDVSPGQTLDELPSGEFSLWSFLMGVATALIGGIVSLGTLARVILSSPVLLKVVEGMVKGVPPEFASKALEGAQGLRDIATLTEKVFDGVPDDTTQGSG